MKNVNAWQDTVNGIRSEMYEFERTWVGSFTTEPIFDIFFWNQYDSVFASLPRSNNLVKGWHNGFEILVGTSNRILWIFLTALKKEEKFTFANYIF